MANTYWMKDGKIVIGDCGNPIPAMACPCTKTGGVELELDNNTTPTIYDLTGGVELELDYTDFAELP